MTRGDETGQKMFPRYEAAYRQEQAQSINSRMHPYNTTARKCHIGRPGTIKTFRLPRNLASKWLRDLTTLLSTTLLLVGEYVRHGVKHRNRESGTIWIGLSKHLESTINRES